MSAERWQQLRVFYDQVLDAPVSERARVLAAVEASHPELHKELLALVAADSAPDSLLDHPLAYLWPPDLSPGDVLCDRFLVERHLGSGGMGDVWAARDQLRDEPVALKTIRTALAYDERSLTRFRREIQLASRVAHPNVCRVHELFEDRSLDPPRLFFTMELLEGETLAARLKRTGALPVSDALQVLRDICAGLDAAHDAGVIHRDLKPANIMLTRRGDSVRVVITDFGLARPDAEPVDESEASAAGVLVGTPDYMAPEQVRGAAATPATDVYAAGLLLFEMLRGEPPFRGTSTLDSWMRRAREGPQPLARLVPGATETIDRVLQHCLQYEPERRFQTPHELVAALDRRPFPRKTVSAVAAAVVIITAATAWNLRPVSLPRDAQQWYDEAQQAVAEGAALRARNAVSRVLATAPGFPPAHALLAEVHLELDMPAEAVEDMARASQLLADGVRLSTADRLYVNGMHALALRECDAAVAALKSRADIADASRPYWMVTAARALERCNRPDDALALLAIAAVVDARNAAVPLRTSRVAARRRRYDDAMGALQKAEDIFRDRNNAEGRSEVLLIRGSLLAEQDKLDDATSQLTSAMQLATSLMDERQQLRVLLQQAIVQRKRGDFESAERASGEALERAQRGGLDTLVVDALFGAANVQIVQRHFDRAEMLLQDALRAAQRQRNEDALAGAQLRLASVFVPAGRIQSAESALTAARPFYERTRDTRNIGKIDAFQGQIDVQRADYAEATSAFRSQLNAATQADDPEEAAQARGNLANALTLRARYPEALPEFAALVAYYQQTKQPVREAYARLNQLDTQSLMGISVGAEAYRLAVQAVPNVVAVQAYATQLRGQDALRRGRPREALQVIESARRDGADAAWIDLTTCLATARLRHGQQDSACARALRRVSHQEMTAGWLEAHLVIAEAYIWCNDVEAAMRLLSEASPIVESSKESENKWHYKALVAATVPAQRYSSAGDQLTRELDEMRLKLGTAYDGWSRRPDVIALLQRANRKETE